MAPHSPLPGHDTPRYLPPSAYLAPPRPHAHIFGQTIPSTPHKRSYRTPLLALVGTLAAFALWTYLLVVAFTRSPVTNLDAPLGMRSDTVLFPALYAKASRDFRVRRRSSPATDVESVEGRLQNLADDGMSGLQEVVDGMNEEELRREVWELLKRGGKLSSQSPSSGIDVDASISIGSTSPTDGSIDRADDSGPSSHKTSSHSPARTSSPAKSVASHSSAHSTLAMHHKRTSPPPTTSLSAASAPSTSVPVFRGDQADAVESPNARKTDVSTSVQAVSTSLSSVTTPSSTPTQGILKRTSEPLWTKQSRR